MNWRAGFFRLWILGAIVWLGLCASITPWGAAGTLLSRGLTEAQFMNGKWQDAPEVGTPPLPDGFHLDAPEKPWERYQAIRAAEQAGAASQLIVMSMVAFVPPLVLLALGVGLAWVAAGFTRRLPR